jgi:hypothetical protein
MRMTSLLSRQKTKKSGTLIMKKTALLIFALYANVVYTDEYFLFIGTENLFNEVGKRSAKLGACLKKHQFLQLIQQEPGSARWTEAMDELMCLTEHELENYPTLKKQFLADLLIRRAMWYFDTKDYVQSEHFCDLAMAMDPENPFAYEIKAHFCREAGNEAQALAYDKLAKEKGIDSY